MAPLLPVQDKRKSDGLSFRQFTESFLSVSGPPCANESPKV